MKVVGIQAKDGTIEVAIDKEETKGATEVIGKGILEDKMNMVGRHKLRLKHQEEIHSHGNRKCLIFFSFIWYILI